MVKKRIVKSPAKKIPLKKAVDIQRAIEKIKSVRKKEKENDDDSV